jgi:hypothetical protein
LAASVGVPLAILVPDFKAAELAGSGAYVAEFVTNLVGKAFANFTEEGIGFLAVAFRHQLDAAVGEVADVAGDGVAPGDRVGCVTEADALDVASVCDGVAVRGRCHFTGGKEAVFRYR